MELGLAVAALRAEDVPGEALAVHPHEDRVVAANIAPHQRDVRDMGDHVLVGVGGDGAVLGRQRGRRSPDDEPLVATPVGDQVRNGHDLDVVLGCEAIEIGSTRHAAVGAHHLADDPRRETTGQLAEIDDRLGLPRALENATRGGAQRKRVARLGEVARLGVLVAEETDRRGAVECADPRGHAVADRLDGHGERRAEPRRVLVDHGADAELIEPPPLTGHADEPAPVGGHEVDRLRGDAIRRDGEVALVLAVLVVDDDHELAGADVLDRVIDGCERHLSAPRVAASVGTCSRDSRERAT